MATGSRVDDVLNGLFGFAVFLGIAIAICWGTYNTVRYGDPFIDFKDVPDEFFTRVQQVCTAQYPRNGFDEMSCKNDLVKKKLDEINRAEEQRKAAERATLYNRVK